MKLEHKTLLLALIGTSAAFAWVVQPCIGAIFWATVLAVVFTPLYRRILPVMRHRATPAALATLFVGVTGVGMPMALIAASLLRQTAGLYADMASHRADFGAYGRRIVEGLPPWVRAELGRLGLGDLAAIQEALTAKALAVSRFVATHLLGAGLDTFGFVIGLGVMLYVFFFLLRDGASLAARIHGALPLADHDKAALFATIVTVIRATVRGGVVMAATQGALGGAVLGWLGIPGPVLWGVVFGLLSMVPVVGAGLLWAPIAIYFVATGVLWKAVTLAVFGTVVLSVVDNVLRPVLVGRDTQLPGYLVLTSTLGGVATFGLSGVVIGPVIAATFVAAWKLFSAAPRAAPA